MVFVTARYKEEFLLSYGFITTRTLLKQVAYSEHLSIALTTIFLCVLRIDSFESL